MQCPVCSKHFNELGKTLPFAHHSQSYLICALSGEPMNEHNPPLVLPNGYVYGQKVKKKKKSITAVYPWSWPGLGAILQL